MRRYLILKLLAINLAVIGFVMVMMWIAVDTLAAGYFVTLMEKYNISPKPAHAMFVSAIHRYLLWACLAAVILAAVLSFAMMRRVLAPLTRMTWISREIAAGNFAVRVPVNTRDEVGQLAQAFNRMAESLEEIENLRRTLMIDVAHELRTPLTNIRGYLEALNDGVLPPSKQTLSLLHTETLRLVKLVEDVLQLARADAAHGNLELVEADLRDMVIAAYKPFARLFAQKNIKVTLKTPKDPVRVEIDKYRMTRVLRNLSDNAVRYTPHNGKALIRIRPGDRNVRVVYANTVGEIPPESLPFIFERFYRGEKSRSRKHGGAGIGLAIVKELVEAHGGSVGAEKAGRGIRIWFELPTHPPDQSG